LARRNATHCFIGGPKRHIQPERYAKWEADLVGMIMLNGFVAIWDRKTLKMYKQLGKNDTVDKKISLAYNKIMENFAEKINIIRDIILKNVAARYIYLFGSYAYGEPTDKSDIDIYIVIPDNAANISEIYGKIMVDLSIKKIYFVDLLLNRESVFHTRKNRNILEKTIYQKGKILYEY
jgi:predicted nucleotidyltransferase